MNGAPEFLEVEDVLDLHAQQLVIYGGGFGVRDQSLLESAVAMPKAGFGGQFVHGDLFEMAAAYAFHIAQNQPFIDGNKRTALLAALVFLDLNGVVIKDPQEVLYDAMIAIAERRLGKVELAKVLRELSQRGAP